MEAAVKFMLNVIEIDGEDQYISDFLTLPSKIYPNKLSTQNKDEEKALLRGTHILSKYFKVAGFLVYKESSICARCMLFIYPNQNTAYLGFFECENNPEYAKLLFASAEKHASSFGCDRILGPINASFWLGYRLKTDKFKGRPYISEPYNKEYYLNLFKECGYSICESYISNIYRRPDANYRHAKYADRFAEFTAKGYTIRSPKRREWKKTMDEVYVLITLLYSNFPVYMPISEEDFRSLFNSFPLILDFSMVKMAYYKDNPVGFFIGMPDYQNRLCGKINPAKLFYLFFRKHFCKRYVMLYMGVLPEHRGLGKAITQSIIQNVRSRGAAAVGAFIHKGKATESYVDNMIEEQYHYVLLDKKLLPL